MRAPDGTVAKRLPDTPGLGTAFRPGMKERRHDVAPTERALAKLLDDALYNGKVLVYHEDYPVVARSLADVRPYRTPDGWVADYWYVRGERNLDPSPRGISIETRLSIAFFGLFVFIVATLTTLIAQTIEKVQGAAPSVGLVIVVTLVASLLFAITPPGRVACKGLHCAGCAG